MEVLLDEGEDAENGADTTSSSSSVCSQLHIPWEGVTSKALLKARQMPDEPARLKHIKTSNSSAGNDAVNLAQLTAAFPAFEEPRPTLSGTFKCFTHTPQDGTSRPATGSAAAVARPSSYLDGGAPGAGGRRTSLAFAAPVRCISVPSSPLSASTSSSTSGSLASGAFARGPWLQMPQSRRASTALENEQPQEPTASRSFVSQPRVRIVYDPTQEEIQDDTQEENGLGQALAAEPTPTPPLNSAARLHKECNAETQTVQTLRNGRQAQPPHPPPTNDAQGPRLVANADERGSCTTGKTEAPANQLTAEAGTIDCPIDTRGNAAAEYAANRLRRCAATGGLGTDNEDDDAHTAIASSPGQASAQDDTRLAQQSYTLLPASAMALAATSAMALAATSYFRPTSNTTLPWPLQRQQQQQQQQYQQQHQYGHAANEDFKAEIRCPSPALDDDGSVVRAALAVRPSGEKSLTSPGGVLGPLSQNGLDASCPSPGCPLAPSYDGSPASVDELSGSASRAAVPSPNRRRPLRVCSDSATPQFGDCDGSEAGTNAGPPWRPPDRPSSVCYCDGSMEDSAWPTFAEPVVTPRLGQGGASLDLGHLLPQPPAASSPSWDGGAREHASAIPGGSFCFPLATQPRASSSALEPASRLTSVQPFRNCVSFEGSDDDVEDAPLPPPLPAASSSTSATATPVPRALRRLDAGAAAGRDGEGHGGGQLLLQTARQSQRAPAAVVEWDTSNIPARLFSTKCGSFNLRRSGEFSFSFLARSELKALGRSRSSTAPASHRGTEATAPSHTAAPPVGFGGLRESAGGSSRLGAHCSFFSATSPSAFSSLGSSLGVRFGGTPRPGPLEAKGVADSPAAKQAGKTGMELLFVVEADGKHVRIEEPQAAGGRILARKTRSALDTRDQIRLAYASTVICALRQRVHAVELRQRGTGVFRLLCDGPSRRSFAFRFSSAVSPVSSVSVSRGKVATFRLRCGSGLRLSVDDLDSVSQGPPSCLTAGSPTGSLLPGDRLSMQSLAANEGDPFHEQCARTAGERAPDTAAVEELSAGAFFAAHNPDHGDLYRRFRAAVASAGLAASTVLRVWQLMVEWYGVAVEVERVGWLRFSRLAQDELQAVLEQQLHDSRALGYAGAHNATGGSLAHIKENACAAETDSRRLKSFGGLDTQETARRLEVKTSKSPPNEDGPTSARQCDTNDGKSGDDTCDRTGAQQDPLEEEAAADDTCARFTDSPGRDLDCQIQGGAMQCAARGPHSLAPTSTAGCQSMSCGKNDSRGFAATSEAESLLYLEARREIYNRVFPITVQLDEGKDISQIRVELRGIQHFMVQGGSSAQPSDFAATDSSRT
eukprot:GHVT01084159.1.p1 GENE.GHVT01084159.1~~GHVT01084159.1.p1  ORF type:complete len:1343 (-),score=307.47 GHVT01084159.1:130-4158(-)